jgi:hypothetical protein
MAQPRQLNFLIAVDAFAFMQFLLDGEAGGWWNRISDGIYRPDDQARALWRVEAAPIGALTTFELERDEISGQWIIRSV